MSQWLGAGRLLRDIVLRPGVLRLAVVVVVGVGIIELFRLGSGVIFDGLRCRSFGSITRFGIGASCGG